MRSSRERENISRKDDKIKKGILIYDKGYEISSSRDILTSIEFSINTKDGVKV